MLDGKGTRLTLLNNWESTYFDFSEDKLRQLLKDTKYPRNDDHAGLDDWQENRQKLPNGIAAIAKEADKIGVKFGIWVEPEMVNPQVRYITSIPIGY